MIIAQDADVGIRKELMALTAIMSFLPTAATGLLPFRRQIGIDAG
jgi:hypothetical protein